jgi:hypothetical protein
MTPMQLLLTMRLDAAVNAAVDSMCANFGDVLASPVVILVSISLTCAVKVWSWVITLQSCIR